MKNCITINLKKDEITLKISDEATHQEIMEALQEKLVELKKLYKDDKTPIFVTGKILTSKEMEEVKQSVISEINVSIEFDSPKAMGLHGIKRVFDKDVTISETKFHHGSLRSGQKLEFEGSIVIIGDVNAGAEVVAGDNIAVLGVLRGLAHAGAKGNRKAIIVASSLNTTQIRISNIVKEMNETEYTDAWVAIEKDEIIVDKI